MKPETYHEKLKNKKGAGFTLVELVVVLTIFILVIDVAVTIFISIVKQQKRILTEQELLNQTSYAIEYMSRSLRGALKDVIGSCLQEEGLQYPGYIYLLTHYNSETMFYGGVKFITSGNVCKEFFLDSDGILKETKNSQEPQPILSDALDVKYARFIINGDKSLLGASEVDLVQPRLTVLLDIQNISSDNQQEKIIQTTVSQRNLKEE